MKLEALPLKRLPEIRNGDDLGVQIVAAAKQQTVEWSSGTVVVVAHKIVSKAEGRTRSLASVVPSRKASELAAATDKDPRLVQVILDESKEILRSEKNVLICRTRHGFICANAGVDCSNVADPETALLLPLDPDHSARTLRNRLMELTGTELALVITDSFGRAWRLGQCETAIGCAGLNPLNDLRGQNDMYGRELNATVIAIGDQIAAAADLVRGKSSGEPITLIKGLDRYVISEDGPGAKALLRPSYEDLFL